MYHRKYRPKKFDEIIGRENKVIAKSIEEDIKNNSLSHTILFSGDPGTGKTTLSRLIAVYLGCTDENINYYEINSSDDRGIDKARQINKESQFPSMVGKTKVIVFDEAHKITTDFKDAILKTTEEPPEYVYYIFCTSMPEKIDKDLLSRCTKYEMKKCNAIELKMLLVNVMKKELINKSDNVLHSIISNSDGIPREALVLLHTIVNMNDNDAIEFLSKPKLETDIFHNLVTALIKRQKWSTVASLLKKGVNNPLQLRLGVLSYISKCLLGQKNTDSNFFRLLEIAEVFREDFELMGRGGLNGLIIGCANLYYEGE